MSLIRIETLVNDGHKYEYLLYVTESTQLASFHLQLYSIEIRLTLKDGSYTNYVAHDVFSDSEKAIRFFEMLVEKLVTPIDLPYVIEDTLFVK